MSSTNNPEQFLKKWLTTNFPGRKLPIASLELHNLIHNIEFEFRKAAQSFDQKDLDLLASAGIISSDRALTWKGRVTVVKLLH